MGTGKRFDASNKPKQTKNKQNKMKINRLNKLEAACTKDDTRPSITQPFIQGGRAIATDGKILASVGIETSEGEEVEGKRIPLDALKGARKNTIKLATDIELNLGDKSCTIANGASYPVEYPDATNIPRVGETVSAKLAKSDAAFWVSFDISLLERLSQALGTEKVTLCFKDNKSIITVLPNEGGDAFGLMMPMRTE